MEDRNNDGKRGSSKGDERSHGERQAEQHVADAKRGVGDSVNRQNDQD